MTTVALYARVSSQNQAQKNTIKSQIAELRHKIAADKHELLNKYIFEDDGASGWILERESLDKLRDKIAEGEIDKVYIHSPDRLSRKSAHQMILLDEFEKAGIEVIFLNYKVENNPESRLLLGMQGLVSEFESTKVMERTRRGKRHRAKEGYASVLNVVPYGFRRIDHVDRNKIRIEINEEEAKIVRQIFIWIGQERVSIREVIRRLRDRSIRTRTGNKVWCPIVIGRMLRNPAYKGQAAFGKLKRVEKISREKRVSRQKVKNYSVCSTDEKNWIYIPVPKIVEEGLFNKVQKQLDENKKRARMQRREGINLLQGLVVCQSCGYAYSGIYQGKGEKMKGYYRCSSTIRITDNKEEKCTNKIVRTDTLETAVWKKVKDILENPETIEKEYQRRISEKKSEESLDKKLARREEKIKQGMKELMEDYYSKENIGENQYISKETFKEAMKNFQEHLKIIEEEKKKENDQKAIETGIKRTISSIKNFYYSIKSGLEQLNWETKRRIIKALIRKIDIGRDQVEIGFQVEEPENDGKIFNLYHCTAHHVAEAIYLSSVCADKMTKNSMYLASHV